MSDDRKFQIFLVILFVIALLGAAVGVSLVASVGAAASESPMPKCESSLPGDLPNGVSMFCANNMACVIYDDLSLGSSAITCDWYRWKQ